MSSPKCLQAFVRRPHGHSLSSPPSSAPSSRSSSASGSLRLPFTGRLLSVLPHYYPRQVRAFLFFSAIERLQASLVSHSRLRHRPRPRLPPHLDLNSRRPRPTPVLTLPPSSLSTMSSTSYRSSSQLPLRRRHYSGEFPRHLCTVFRGARGEHHREQHEALQLDRLGAQAGYDRHRGPHP